MARAEAFRIMGRAAGVLAVLAAVAALLAGPRAAAAQEDLSGRLLVAAPGLEDTNFAHTLVYMVRHDSTGAMGLVVNRPMGEVPLAELLALVDPGAANSHESPAAHDETAPRSAQPVFYGGPVDPYRGFTLHSRDVMLESSEFVDENTAMAPWEEALPALARGEGPHRLVLLLGYAGWAPGQLESELERGDWYVTAADPSLVFSEDPARAWERAVARLGTEL